MCTKMLYIPLQILERSGTTALASISPATHSTPSSPRWINLLGLMAGPTSASEHFRSVKSCSALHALHS